MAKIWKNVNAEAQAEVIGCNTRRSRLFWREAFLLGHTQRSQQGITLPLLVHHYFNSGLNVSHHLWSSAFLTVASSATITGNLSLGGEMIVDGDLTVNGASAS